MQTIVEVGAYSGEQTLRFLSDTNSRVFAFEPETEAFQHMFKLSQQYQRLVVLPFAVDIGDNQEPLWHGGDGHSTLNVPNFGSIGSTFSMTWTMRMDTFMRLYSVDQIDYLCIDAPFREELILESLAERVKDVKGGCYQQYSDEPFAMDFLKTHGFDVLKNEGLNKPLVSFWRKS